MVNLSTNEQLAEILMIFDVVGKNGGKNHVLLSANKVRNTNYTYVFLPMSARIAIFAID